MEGLRDDLARAQEHYESACASFAAMLEELEALYVAELGPASPELAARLRGLAAAWRRLERVADAEALCARARAIEVRAG